MELAKYSIGIGDRFGLEGRAQLRALQAALDLGPEITPVWNKSEREHMIIGSRPGAARVEADEAVAACRWKGAYFVDADHIRLDTVNRFLESCDFFTIDIADVIGRPAAAEPAAAFFDFASRFIGRLQIPGLEPAVRVTPEGLADIARKYLLAVVSAGRVYRLIETAKGPGNFIAEVSFDEADRPQSPAELFFILAAAAMERIPLQTLAPKFQGAFLKGVDYVGDVKAFLREFADDVAVVAYARDVFGLPPDLKLSVHSGSDKFSLYPGMHRVLSRAAAGVHLKTAGTTWLEEVAGLAASGGKGLRLVQEIYGAAFERFDELAGPYRGVVDINRLALPDPETVASWTSGEFVEVLDHGPSRESFQRDFRQLMHIGYKIAAEVGEEFYALLKRHREAIESRVTDNLLRRHIAPLFLGPEIPGGSPAP